VELWMELLGREDQCQDGDELAIQVLEELAIYHEHRRRDAKSAILFAEEAIRRLQGSAGEDVQGVSDAHRRLRRFTLRKRRLQRKSARLSELPLGRD
jgi:hypothetical protein